MLKQSTILVVLLGSINGFAIQNSHQQAQQIGRPVEIIEEANPQADFEKFYKMRSTKFHGRAQNLSAFNLDLEMVIHYSEPLLEGRPYTFSFATNGNLHIAGVPVFPVEGSVKFELKDDLGRNLQLKIDGEPVVFRKQTGTFYMVESEAGYQKRKARISQLNKNGDFRYERATGKMIAVVKFDLLSQKIQFFQVDPQTGELVSSGVFEGKVR